MPHNFVADSFHTKKLLKNRLSLKFVHPADIIEEIRLRELYTLHSAQKLLISTRAVSGASGGIRPVFYERGVASTCRPAEPLATTKFGFKTLSYGSNMVKYLEPF